MWGKDRQVLPPPPPPRHILGTIYAEHIKTSYKLNFSRQFEVAVFAENSLFPMKLLVY